MINEQLVDHEQIAMIGRAKQLAEKWHAGITRKLGGAPYVTHPAAVAEFLQRYGFSTNVVCAAWCHDLLEDTECTEDEIREACNQEVVDLVRAVSHDGDGEWRARKQRYIEQVRAASDDAKAICCADKIHNAQSIVDNYPKMGPALWDRFHGGREGTIWFDGAVLKMLQDSWSHPMIEEYAQLVEKLEQL